MLASAARGSYLALVASVGLRVRGEQLKFGVCGLRHALHAQGGSTLLHAAARGGPLAEQLHRLLPYATWRSGLQQLDKVGAALMGWCTLLAAAVGCSR